MPKKKEIILASSSPRRRELLSPFFNLRIYSPEIDEEPRRSESATQYVRRMAYEKWLSLFGQYEALPMLAADTIVVQGSKIFGKPRDQKEAAKFLRAFSGQTHYVISSVCVGKANGRKAISRVKVVKTRIKFRKLKKHEIDSYLFTNEWEGKAGAYGIQGSASLFVDSIQGSLTNVIGLPLKESLELL